MLPIFSFKFKFGLWIKTLSFRFIKRERTRVGETRETWRGKQEAARETLSEEPNPSRGSQPCFLLLFLVA